MIHVCETSVFLTLRLGEQLQEPEHEIVASLICLVTQLLSSTFVVRLHNLDYYVNYNALAPQGIRLIQPGSLVYPQPLGSKHQTSAAVHTPNEIKKNPLSSATTPENPNPDRPSDTS